jgi:glucokinase
MDVPTLSQLNEFLVLDAVGARGEVTRHDLASALGLSQASVSRIVKRLVEAGMVTEAPSPSGSPGRDPLAIRLNQRAGGVIAIDLGGTKCHGALADFTGEVVAEDFRQTQERGTPFEALVACIEAMRAAAADAGLPVRAVAIGIPAVVDPETGLVVQGPNVGWDGFDLRGVLAEHVGEPLVIDNDVNLAAFGQAWRGDGRSVDNFVTLSIGTGVGGAIVSGGELVRGHRNSAGEIGNLITRSDQLRAAPGPMANFEDVASGPALARAARALLEAEGQASSLDAATLTAHDVFRAAAEGDPVGTRVIEGLLVDVAVAVVALRAVVAPELVILDGSVGRALEPYVARLEELVAAQGGTGPGICVSHLGPNATVAGAIASGLALVRQSGAPAALLSAVNMSNRVAAAEGRPATDGTGEAPRVP